MKIKLGYARVSTVKQSTDNQVAKLEAYGCTETFADPAVSGKNNHESKKYLALMARVLELTGQGEEVEVCVTKLDRFGRSLPDLLNGVEQLGSIGASFTAIDDSFSYDAMNPASKLMLQMLGALADFERSLITSRMREGMEAKVAKGLKRGQKPKLTSAAVKAIRTAYAAEPQAPGRIAKEWGVSRSTIIRVLDLYGQEEPYTTLDEWEAAKARANA